MFQYHGCSLVRFRPKQMDGYCESVCQLEVAEVCPGLNSGSGRQNCSEKMKAICLSL